MLHMIPLPLLNPKLSQSYGLGATDLKEVQDPRIPRGLSQFVRLPPSGAPGTSAWLSTWVISPVHWPAKGCAKMGPVGKPEIMVSSPVS